MLQGSWDSPRHDLPDAASSDTPPLSVAGSTLCFLVSEICLTSELKIWQASLLSGS